MNIQAFCLLVMCMALPGFTHNEATMKTEIQQNVRSSDASLSFEEVLHAAGPSSELNNSDVYNWLIGSWEMRVLDYDGDGSVHESRGEWHFEWVLEGRAIQDVFVVPSRNQRSGNLSKENNRYGTSIRVYDPSIKAWRVTWINPVRQVENHLIGKKVGDEIIQEGMDPGGSSRIRWCFRDIRKDSFRWTGEESTDNGKTWQLGAEFYGTRMSSNPK